MHPVSFSFIFLFLPAAVLVYYLLPGRFRNLCLLILSLVFFAMLDWREMLLMLGIVSVQYLSVCAMHCLGQQHKAGHWLCTAVVVFTVGVLVVWAAVVQINHTQIPLGLLVYSLTGLGYVVDFRRGEAEFESPVRFGVMCCFFGKLYAGPLVEYQDMVHQLHSPQFSLAEIGEGMLQFVQGMAKKVILADQVAVVYTTLQGISQSELPVLGAWMLVLCSAFSTYFTLSAYCDMAMGLGRVFGLSLPKNFAYPFQSRTVTDFFARFNITVTRYIRRYVYRFLGYDSGGRLSTTFNLMLTALLAGLWFGLRLSTLAWGMFLGVFMIIEVLWGHKLFEHIPPFFLRIYTFAVVLLSFAFLSSGSLGQVFNTLSVMTGLAGRSFINETVQYLLVSRLVLLIFCVLFSTSLYSRVAEWYRKRHPAAARFFAILGNTFLLVLTLAMMI